MRNAANAVVVGKYITLHAYIRKKSQVNDLGFHFKQLEEIEQIKPNISKRKKKKTRTKPEINKIKNRKTVEK